MIILYDYFTPAYKAGGPIQSLQNLVTALDGQLPMKVVCSNRDLDGAVLDVPADQWVDVPAAQVYYNSGPFAGIKKLLAAAPGETLFINGIYSPVYNLLPLMFARGRKIVSARGMLHPGGLSQKSLKKKLYLRFWKLAGLHRRASFHATTEEEKKHIQNVFGRQTQVYTIPNFPRIMDFVPAAPAAELRLVTIALISPMKNHLLVIEALRQVPERVHYNIYGPVKDAAYWQQCAAAIKTLPEHIKVQYHGDLEPAQVARALQDNHVYVQPSKSENFGHSLFEALTAGKPVITSRYTPWNGLREKQAGDNVSIEDTAGLARAISFFARMQPATFGAWAANARAAALDTVDIAKLQQDYLDMFRQAATNKEHHSRNI